MENRKPSTGVVKTWGATAVAFLAFAGLLLLPEASWRWLDSRIPERGLGLEKGLVRDRLELAELQQSPASQRLVVIGSSRVQAAFRPERLNTGPVKTGELAVATLAHPGVHSFEILSLVDRVRAARPDTVAIGLSEIDLFGNFGVVPQGGQQGLRTLKILGRHLGWRRSFENRVLFYRLSLGSLLEPYQYRRVLQAAVFDRFLRFPSDERLRPQRTAPLLAAWQLERLDRRREREAHHRSLEEAESLQVQVSERAQPNLLRVQLRILYSLRDEANAEAHRHVLAEAIQVLRDAGIRVVLFELPLHPLARERVPPEIRRQSRSTLEELASTEGAMLLALSLEDLSPEDQIPVDEFVDLVHLAFDGDAALAMTRRVVTAATKSP